MKTIPLTKGYVAIVDDEDYEELNQFKWLYCKGYACRSTREPAKIRKRVFMHHHVLRDKGARGTGSWIVADHINRNSLDNRRKNLRLTTQSVNALNKGIGTNNKSGYRGVYWVSREKRWVSSIKLQGRLKYLGYFKDKMSAIKARLEFEKTLAI